MTDWALDASAVLALLNQEPGAEQVADALSEDATISAVNLSEVVAKLADRGFPENEIRETLGHLSLNVTDFDPGSAFAAGLLRPTTRAAGLSLGDRACLALAGASSRTALTADRSWAALAMDVQVKTIR